MPLFFYWTFWLAIVAGLVAHWVFVHRRRRTQPIEAVQVQMAVELRRLRRERDSWLAYEDKLVADAFKLSESNRTLRAQLKAQQQESLTLAKLADELRADLARAEVERQRRAGRLMPLPDLPPGFKAVAYGDYRATFSVLPEGGGGAHVSVVASSRQALRAVVEPFTALAADTGFFSKECEGRRLE